MRRTSCPHLWLRLWIRLRSLYPHPVSIGSERILAPFQWDEISGLADSSRDLIRCCWFLFFQRALAGRAGAGGLADGDPHLECLGTQAVLLAGKCPSFGSVPLRGPPTGRTASHHQRKETTAAARRSARGVPPAGFAAGLVSLISLMGASAPAGWRPLHPRAAICRSPVAARGP